MGVWNSDYEDYQRTHVVTHNGSSWVFANEPEGRNPEPGTDFSVWQLVASEGDAGPAGAEGPQGDPGPQGPEGPSGQAAGKLFYPAPSLSSDVAPYKKALASPSPAGEQTIVTAIPTIGTDVLVAQFITEPGQPGAVDYPAGSAFRRLYAQVSPASTVCKFHLKVYKRTAAGVETLVRDEYSNGFSDQSVTPQQWSATSSAAGALAADDRLVLKLYALRFSGGGSGSQVTTYFEGSTHASQVQTTISAGAQGAQGPQGPAGAPGPAGGGGGSLAARGPNWYTLPMGTFSGSGPITGVNAVPFDVPWPCQVEALAFSVTTFLAGGTAKGYIFEDYGGWPGLILAQQPSFAIDLSTNGFKDWVLATPLAIPTPRRIWTAFDFSYPSGSAACRQMGTSALPLLPNLDSTRETAVAGVKPPGANVAADTLRAWTPGASQLHGSGLLRIWVKLTPLP